MNFEIEGLDEFLVAMDRAPHTVRQEIEPAMKDALGMVRRRVRPPVRTGRLARRWFRAVEMGRDGVTGSLYTDVFYAPFLEFGTKYLAARAFLERAFRAAQNDVAYRFGRALDRILQRMAR